MREIKFKIWEPHSRGMYGPYHISDIAEQQTDTLLYALYPWGEGLKGDLVYLQYTGIKDTHGNEIYEGDVISYREEDNAILTGEVRMRDGAFCVMGMILEKREFKLVYLHDIKVPVRIIGNGYEGMSSFRGGE